MYAPGDVILQEIKQPQVALLLPAAHGQQPRFKVGTKDDFLRAVLLEPALEKRWRFDGCCASRHLLGPAFKSDAQALVRFDAAAEVDPKLGMGSDALQYPVIDDALGSRTIQVNQMEALQAVGLKGLGGIQGVFVVNGFLLVIALGQAHAFAFYDIYGGDDVHNRP